MDVDGGGSKRVFHRLGGQQSDPSKNQKVCYHWRAGKCNRHPCPFLHRELPALPSQQGLNGIASTKRHHAFAANTDGPSSWNRGPNNFNGDASSTWGAGEEIDVRIRVLRALDDEFDLGFHELSLCVNEWSSLNSTVSVKWSSLNSTLVLSEVNLDNQQSFLHPVYLQLASSAGLDSLRDLVLSNNRIR